MTHATRSGRRYADTRGVWGVVPPPERSEGNQHRSSQPHLPQDETMGRSDRSDFLAIPGGDDLYHLLGPATAEPDIDAEPHQRPHHLMTERPGLHPEDDAVILGPPSRLENLTHGRRPGPLSTEAGEVVLADEAGCGDVHRLEVEGTTEMPYPVARQRVGSGARVDEVAVRPPTGREPGVEPFGSFGSRQDRHLAPQHPIE